MDPTVFNSLVVRNSVEHLTDLAKQSLDRRSSGLDKLPDVTTSLEYDGMKFSKRKVDIMILLFFCTFAPEYFLGFAEYLQVEIRRYLSKALLFPELNALTHLGKNKYTFLWILENYTRWNSDNLQSILADGTTVERVLSNIHLIHDPSIIFDPDPLNTTEDAL